MEQRELLQKSVEKGEEKPIVESGTKKYKRKDQQIDETEKIKQDTMKEKHQQKKQYDKKKQHQNRKKNHSKYDFNADLITLETEIPNLPKKSDLLKKPNVEKYKQKEQKNNIRIQKLKDKKKQIRKQNFKLGEKLQKGQNNKYDIFRSEITKVKELRQNFTRLKIQRRSQINAFTTLINQAKQNHTIMKQLHELLKNSKQNLIEKHTYIERKLISGGLTKQEEKKNHQEMLLIERKLKQCQNTENLEIKLMKVENTKEQLDRQITKKKEQKQIVQEEYQQVKCQIEKKTKYIDELKKFLDDESKEKTQVKEKNDHEWQKWKNQKQKKLNEIDDKIKLLKKENDTLWQEYYESKDNYWQQRELISFIEWQIRVKNRKQIQKDKQNRAIQINERNKQRQKQNISKQYQQEIQTCKYLIKYLNNIQNINNKQQQEQQIILKKQQYNDINKKLQNNQQWQKQKQKGIQIIQCKKKLKSNQQFINKKNKKYKKKKKDQELNKQDKISFPFNLQAMFDSIKVLAPLKSVNIKNTIEQLKELIQLFERVSKQQVLQNDIKKIQEIKGVVERKIKKNQKKIQKEQQQQQFPTI